MKWATRLGALGRNRWLLRAGIAIVVLVALFGAVGYWVLPGVIQSQIQKIGSAKLHRSLTLERVQVQPFRLAIALDGVKLMEADGRTVFASLQRIETQISASSLLHLAPVIKELRVSGPYVHVQRLAANRYNFDDMVAALAAAHGRTAR